MSEKQESIKELVLQKRDEGKVVFMTLEGAASIPVDVFIRQPVNGILYDLNRLEETALTFMPDPKWVNDFAVALTIRALYADKAALEARLSKMEEDVRHMKRWASGFNVQVNPQVVLDAVVRMCDEALAGENEVAHPNG